MQINIHVWLLYISEALGWTATTPSHTAAFSVAIQSKDDLNIVLLI